LVELPHDVRDKVNQARGTKRWKIVLAAKVKSVLDDEKRDRVKPGLESGAPGGGMFELLKARLSATHSSMVFTNEWTSFVLSLMSEK
jgi:hypothetical protein